MNKKIKIEIKNRWTGNILFEYEKENNTLKDTLEKAVKVGANLEGAYLGGANLEGAYLGGACLKGANLKGAYLEGANLEGAYLGGANLEGAYLGGACLKGAYLGGACLEGAYLEGANLKGANLEGANLKGAYLRGAYLEGACLKGANLEGAYIYLCDGDDDYDYDEIVKNFEENADIKITKHYINHDIIPTRWNCIWENGLIIREYEIKPKEIKKMTVKEICEQLGYDVEIVKEKKDE